MMRRTLPLLLAFPCLTSAALAQFGDPIQLETNPLPLAWQDMRRLVAGHFTDNGALDAIQRRAGFALHVLAPPVHNHIQNIFSNAVEVVTVPGGGTEGRDALITAGSFGIRYHEQNATPAWGWQLIIGPFHEDPLRLIVDDYNGDDKLDLIELFNDGTAIFFYSDIIGNKGAWGSPTYIQPAGGVMHDIVCLDWDGSGPNTNKEIGILQTGYTGVIDSATGNEVQTTWKSMNRGSSASRIAVARTLDPLSSDTDRLIVTHRISNQDRLARLDKDTSSPVNFQILTGLPEPVAIATGDLDGDQIDDLVLSYKTNHELVIFYSNGTTSYDTTMADPLDFKVIDFLPGVAPTLDQLAWPVVADFDQDTDNDILFAVQQDSNIYFWENDELGISEDSDDYRPTLNAGASTVVFDDGDPAEETVTLVFDLPNVILPGHTQLQTVIRERDAGAVEPHMPNLANQHFLDVLSTGTTQSVKFKVDVDSLGIETVWDIVVRTVKPGGVDTLSEGGCAWVGSFHTYDDGESALALELGVLPGDGLDIAHDVNQGPGGTISTGVFTRIKLPCYQDVTIPTVPPAMQSL